MLPPLAADSVLLNLVKENKTELIRTYLNVQLKLVKVQSIPDTNVVEAHGDSDFLPFKLARDVKLYCWPKNHLCNFTEFVVFTVLWQAKQGCSKDTFVDERNIKCGYQIVYVVYQD